MVSVVVLGLACSPSYGRQSCKVSSECGSAQYCNLSCTKIDAGPGVEVSGLCRKACVADTDCGDLGLKKPVCAGDTCGQKACIENPF